MNVMSQFIVGVQLLPSRRAVDATSFDPFFRPPAPDPPRNLPPIIRAGTVIPAVGSTLSQEDVPAGAVETVDSSRSAYIIYKKQFTVLLILVVTDVCLLMICAYVSTLVQSWRHQPGEVKLKAWKMSILKKPTLQGKDPLSHTRDLEMVSF
jgi:hypothetical protein